MNSDPIISIIIPAHNARQYLERCLKAVAKSTYEFFETIVVDDGSIDETADIGGKNGAKVFKLQTKSGPAAARSWGAKKAKGDILLFIDADVLIRPDTVERVVNDLTTN
jgi:glycosyltransferase involved in cell wall biosynthesis